MGEDLLYTYPELLRLHCLVFYIVIRCMNAYKLSSSETAILVYTRVSTTLS